MAGHRFLTAPDPEEHRLRVAWYETLGTPQHKLADSRLAAYLWKRAQAEVAEDRRKHPKAKRNQLPEGPVGTGRNLP